MDFAGHVNGKWLAANPIPGDRSSWGAFEMLAERSLAVQRQLAEQAAAKTGGTGVDKIVGDFAELLEKIADLMDILARPERITEIIAEEL